MKERWRWWSTTFAQLAVAALCPLLFLTSKSSNRIICPPSSWAEADVSTIAQVVGIYADAHEGCLPDSLEVLVRQDESGRIPLNIDHVPLDPWGRPFHYELCVRGPTFRVYSLGADGQPGGKGEARDIDSAELSRR